MRSFLFVFIALCGMPVSSPAQQLQSQGPAAWLQGDTLHIENQRVAHRYAWNDGNIMLLEMADKLRGKTFGIRRPAPDFLLPEGAQPANGQLSIRQRQANPFESAYTAVEIELAIGGVRVKRVISIYDDSPAIRHAFYFRGQAAQPYWEWAPTSGLEMIEQRDNNDAALPRMGIVPFADKHWRFKAVSFREATDHQDNPVFVRTLLNYRQKESVSANLLIAENPGNGLSFFVLKEAPIGDSQAHYPGFDFQVDHNGLTIHGLGIAPAMLQDEWQRGYGYALGLTSAEPWQLSADLLAYQKKVRQFVPERDGMLLANTWGDRSKDSRMTEAFILAEIDRAAALGITHLQLDDGWQQGLSRNSASKAGMNWDSWSVADWQPHAERFPRGLQPIMDKARANNIEICLWFNPTKENDYELWERDAAILIGYYEEFGIRVFKIDGMSLASQASEQNLRKLFAKVMEATGSEAVFNMDVTAGQRVGYHFFPEFGNVFLENRYTDWGNYYPHRTLRNLWLLAAYMPADRLQIEFLNVFRNQKTYGDDDPLAPHRVGLPYAFGVSMAGQPLAWMELTGLGEGQERLSALIAAYRAIAPQLHQSLLLPVGDEPSGFSWTGFVALQEGQPQYLIAYREANGEQGAVLDLPMPATGATFLFGDSPASYGLSEDGKAFQLELPGKHQFAVFRLH